MQNYQTATKTYLDKVSTFSQNPQLVDFASNLLAQWQTIPFPITPDRVIFSLATTSAEFNDLEQIVQLAYTWRYCGDQPATLSNFNQPAPDDSKTKTFVAKVVHQDQTLVLATVRLVQDHLELFTFFDLEPGFTWPHQAKNLTPYEFERLAFHPLFDLTKDRALQAFLVNGLHQLALSSIAQSDYWLGCTMRHNVKKFIDSTNIKTVPIPGLRFVKCYYTDFLISLFPQYFQDFCAYEIV